MNQASVDILQRLNRDFYHLRAAEFAATRRRPWPGWGRALALYRRRAAPAAPRRVLDLGCGNGRLGAFLADSLGGDHSYLGVDVSLPLLAAARRFPGAFPGARFVAADLLAQRWPLKRRGAGFSWVAAFGLLHHVAGAENRRRFMSRVAGLLAPGGLATISFWQFADHPRFRRRMLRPAPGDRSVALGAELGDGDYLLRWGAGDDVRYCHHVADAEAEELAAASGLEPVARYRSDGEDGALNLYLLLARGPAPPLAVGADE